MDKVKSFIEENAVGEGFLGDWYQNSVTDAPPVWTDEHISEVCSDFYLIPKEAVDKTSESGSAKPTDELQAYKEIGSIEELRMAMKYVRLAKKHGTVGSVIDACAEYEEIGTVEEFRTARLKRIPQPLDFDGANWYRCPNGCEVHKKQFERDSFCPKCGQSLQYKCVEQEGMDNE